MGNKTVLAESGELRFFVRQLLRVLGVRLDLVAQYPHDIPQLRNLSLQLVITFLLLWALQGVAIAMITKSLYVGLIAGFITTSIITMANRAFLAADFRADGELQWAQLNGGSQDAIKKIKSRHRVSLLLRYLFSALISFCVVTLASLALIRFEIETEIAADVAEIRKPCTFTLRDYREYLEAQQVEQRKIYEAAMQAYHADMPTLGSLEALDNEVQGLRELTQSLEEERAATLLLIDGEERGKATVSSQLVDTNERLTGIAGCGRACAQLKKRLADLNQSIEQNRQQIKQLTEEKTFQQSDLFALREAYRQSEPVYQGVTDEEINARIMAKKAVLSEDIPECNPEYQSAGIVRVLVAAQEVYQGNSFWVNVRLSIVFFWVLLMETMVFTTAWVTRCRVYSLALWKDSQVAIDDLLKA